MSILLHSRFFSIHLALQNTTINYGFLPQKSKTFLNLRTELIHKTQMKTPHFTSPAIILLFIKGDVNA